MAKVKYSFRGGEPIGYQPSKRRGKGGCLLLIIVLIAGLILWYFLAANNGLSKVLPPSVVGNKEKPAIPSKADTSNPGKSGTNVNTDANVKKADKADAINVAKQVAAPVLSGKKLSAFNALCDQAENNYKKENYWQARIGASAALKMVPQTSLLWDKAAGILGRVNSKLIDSDVPCPKKVLYTIEHGDILQKIARKHNTSMEQVLKSNNMPKNKYRLWAGNTLKIYRGDWKIKISKKHHMLYLYDGDELFKSYKIGIGKQDRTPIGEFKVSARIKEPDWYAPNGTVYEYGAKGKDGKNTNVLGTRWIALKPTGKTTMNLKGYGIHGTWDRESIGKAKSNGCIRMLNEDVEELFRLIPLGVNVEIIEK